jgi:hypothetical protein
MKNSLLTGLVSAVLLTSASAAPIITITMDENCNGTIDGFTGLAPLGCGLAADPGPGGLASAITYNLLNPPGLVAGDLVLQEIAGAANSDIVRFNPQQNGGSAVFYSDIFDAPTDLADTGFPTAFYTNIVRVIEIGPEGANGFTYTPTAGQPGFVAGAAAPVTYVIISDISDTPEPASAALFLAGAGLLIARKRLLKHRYGR